MCVCMCQIDIFPKKIIWWTTISTLASFIINVEKEEPYIVYFEPSLLRIKKFHRLAFHGVEYFISTLTGAVTIFYRWVQSWQLNGVSTSSQHNLLFGRRTIHMGMNSLFVEMITKQSGSKVLFSFFRFRFVLTITILSISSHFCFACLSTAAMFDAVQYST